MAEEAALCNSNQKASLADMENNAQARAEKYASARSQHPAWLLLASRRAPLLLSCLRTLFEKATDGIAEEDALQALSEMLVSHASNDLYEIDKENIATQAGRDLREWIKRRLIAERSGRIYATDALEMAIQFVDSLENRIMTSTASRLSVVQREIENLEVSLNPHPAGRIASLRRRIKDLEHELEQVEAGKFTVLDDVQAVEGIREIYALATGLRADFRRVEDSWRDADRALRQSIISEQFHRGEIVDRLLDSQDSLLSTPEGRVFESFQLQLKQSAELDMMRERLRTILIHPAVPKALGRGQQQELRSLVSRLVLESQAVLQARARSEKDVRGFMKTGLAAEHHRVGNLLNELLESFLSLEWERQATRRRPVPIAPIGVAMAGVPAIERLRFKSLGDDEKGAPDLSEQASGLDQIGDEFWDAFAGLDRQALIDETLRVLAEQNRSMTIGELAAFLPPAHDLETFSLWIFLAREAGIDVVNEERESVIVEDDEKNRWQFSLPFASLEAGALKDIDWEI